MKTKPNNPAFRIMITGDFCPINRIEELCRKNDYNAIYNDLLPLLHDNDLTITNLECPLTDSYTPIKKTGPHLYASAVTAEALKAGGFDAVTMANNHIMDQGRSGLSDTLDRCRSIPVATVGAGMNAEEAGKIVYIRKENQNIALINACENEFSIATEKRAGANHLDDINMLKDIADAKNKAALILVIVHAGTEGFHLPSPNLVRRLRAYADFGASAILVSHSHIVSGYEIYNGVPILYGLGNFIFDKSKKTLPEWNEGILCRLEFRGAEFQELELIPFFQNKEIPGAQLMHEQEKKTFLTKIDERSAIIRDADKLQAEWAKFSKQKSYRRFIPVLLNFNRLQRNAFKRNLLKNRLIKEQQLLRLLDLFRCESHRETIIELLEQELNIKQNE